MRAGMLTTAKTGQPLGGAADLATASHKRPTGRASIEVPRPAIPKPATFGVRRRAGRTEPRARHRAPRTRLRPSTAFASGLLPRPAVLRAADGGIAPGRNRSR